jgi:Transposase family tnp2
VQDSAYLIHYIYVGENNDDDMLFTRLARWAQDIPRQKYIELKRMLESQGIFFPSLRRQSQRLAKLTGIEAQFIDCCRDSCIAFTGKYADATECPYCQQERFQDTDRKKPWKTALYIPLVPRLRLQYRDAARAEVLTGYRQSLEQSGSTNEVQDFFDGRLFRDFHLRELDLFKDPHDVALHLSLDGLQLTNMSNHEVTPVIFMNLNLPPQERYKVDNILAGMLIPGPKKPKALDTFLRPLVDELNKLGGDGFPALDGRNCAEFQLRAWVTMVTGDGPALAEAIGMKRPGNAVRPCRTCMIKAELASRTYYVPHSEYDFENPPLRSNLREMIQLVEEADSDDYRRETGITRSSILLELRSLHFPRSFPVDIMHLVLQNLSPTLFKLWSRTKLAIDKPSHEDFEVRSYHLDDEAIESVSSALDAARGTIPTYLGHAPRRIDNHHKGYKAAEWEAWLELFGVPLLDQRLDEECVQNFRDLSRIYSIATRHSVSSADIALLETLVVRFVQSYEQIYLYGSDSQRDPRRLPVCSVNVHYLLHLPAYIRDCGPARYWWQFPMERFCGIIKPRAKSKSQLSTGLANALVLIEHLNHVRFTAAGHGQETTDTPTLAYPALQGRYKAQLASYQSSCLERICSDVEEVEFYKRCQVRDDLTIGSTASQRTAAITRSNCRVCYAEMGNNEMRFGNIHFFIRVLSVDGQVRDLAWISQLEDVDIDREKRIASFGREGRRTWVDVRSIRSLIGILKHENVNFIVTDIDLFK